MVPFDALPAALERLLAGGVRGKLVLAVDPAATGPAAGGRRDLVRGLEICWAAR
jgi:hypothetical protein